MKRFWLPWLAACGAVLVLASCLGDDDNETVYYDDTAISAFTLGTLNQYLHTTTAQGNDSIYKKTLTGSTYKFYIDQQKREIYNPDSLPYGTDAAHVVCTITAKNNASVALKSLTSDSLKWYSSTDSIDFTQPRTMRVYSNRGTSWQEYTVHVNVHKEKSNEFQWTLNGTDDAVARMEGMKAVTLNGRLLLFGRQDGQTVVMARSSENAWQWLTHNYNSLMDADAWANLAVLGDSLYMKDGALLMRTADGENWTLAATANGLRQLVGAGSTRLYAIGIDGKLLSSDDGGQTWDVEQTDSDSALLPTQDISMAVLPLPTNDDAERIVLTGNRNPDAFPDDSTAVVWSKIEEKGAATGHHGWMYHNVDDSNRHPLPRLQSLSMLKYGDYLMAVGGAGLGACTTGGFQQLYESRDGGIVWRGRDYLPLPDGLQCNGVTTFVCDADNRLWLFCGGSGQVWRGRLNQRGWASGQTAFTE